MTEKEQLQEDMRRIKDRLSQIDYNSRSILGRNLLYWRGIKQLSQQELADSIGVTRVTITNIERGTCDTTLRRLMQICGIFGITPNDLLLESR